MESPKKRKFFLMNYEENAERKKPFVRSVYLYWQNLTNGNLVCGTSIFFCFLLKELIAFICYYYVMSIAANEKQIERDRKEELIKQINVTIS